MVDRSATPRSIAAMQALHLSGLYVTGTDTGIGKTHASSALLHALRARGLRAVGMKPVASGCERNDAGWRNEDALALQAASNPRPTYDDINPYALPQPLAPQLAARDAGVDIELDVLLAAHARLAAQADCVVVEGVGGWAAPLSDTLLQADLARALALPIVLVVGLRLGCLNHAFLSARAIADDGLRLVGWIGNAIDPDMARREDNLALLAAGLPAPCWGVLPHAPSADAVHASRCLRMPDAMLRVR
jgi:dethiobiotin synthetase